MRDKVQSSQPAGRAFEEGDQGATPGFTDNRNDEQTCPAAAEGWAADEAECDADHEADSTDAALAHAGFASGRLVLTRTTAEAIFAYFPALRDFVAHRRLLAYSLAGSLTHKDVDASGRSYRRVVISNPMLASFQDMGLSERHKKYIGRVFLERHKQILPAFEVTGWRKGKYCRQVRNSGLPAGLLDLIQSDLATPAHGAEDLVDFAEMKAVPDPTSGRAAQAEKEDRQMRRMKARYSSPKAAKWPVQTQLLQLLNSAPGNARSRLIRQNARNGIEVASRITGDRRRLRVLANLRDIQLRPDVVYAPSRTNRSPRVYATGVTALGLPKAVRKALFGGAVELDLANSQLACAARMWGIESVLEFLRCEGAVWPRFLAATAGTHALSDDAAKGVLKEALYSVIFGKTAAGVEKFLAAALSPEAARVFLGDPLIADLFAARDRALSAIDADGGICDVYGVHHAVTGTKDRRAQCRSALGCMMQVLEMQLLEPVISEAKRESARSHPAFRVVAWQHDGLTVTASRSSVLARLARLVDEQTAKLGVPTRLVVKVLPVDDSAKEKEDRSVYHAESVEQASDFRSGGVSCTDRLGWIRSQTVGGGPDGTCWMWQGPRDRNGYGRVGMDGRKVRMHRLAWELDNGRPVPEGLVVRHSCHTPSCVNPAHLAAGTQRENIADSVAAERMARGERNGRSVLREPDVVEIRSQAEQGIAQARTARQFGVHRTTVRDIVQRKIWRYMPSTPKVTA